MADALCGASGDGALPSVVFSDVDGTVLDAAHRVSPRTAAAARELAARGVPLVQEGEKVSAGQKLADCGEGESFAVARAVLLCEGVYTYACGDAQGAKARAVPQPLQQPASNFYFRSDTLHKRLI